jgi:Tol biopolymer transport system component
MGRLAVLSAVLVLSVPALAQAAFPGSNGRLAYDGFPGPGDSEIFSLLTGSGFPKQLTNDTLGQGEPNWSANGRLIAFSQEGAAPVTSDIWIMNADGSRPRHLTSGHVDNYPAFSPNGRAIVFERDGGIFRMTSKGKHVRRLTNGDGNFLYDLEPTWSPRGNLIAYSSNAINRKLATTDIWTMRPDGSHKRNLTLTRKVYERSADFSPSGGSIVYARFPVSSKVTHSTIWRMRSNGRRRHLVPISDAFSEKTSPAFSPNGTRLAFASSSRFGTKDGLFTVPSGGGNAARLGVGADLANDPSWQPR